MYDKYERRKKWRNVLTKNVSFNVHKYVQAL